MHIECLQPEAGRTDHSWMKPLAAYLLLAGTKLTDKWLFRNQVQTFDAVWRWQLQHKHVALLQHRHFHAGANHPTLVSQGYEWTAGPSKNCFVLLPFPLFIHVSAVLRCHRTLFSVILEDYPHWESQMPQSDSFLVVLAAFLPRLKGSERARVVIVSISKLYAQSDI